MKPRKGPKPLEFAEGEMIYTEERDKDGNSRLGFYWVSLIEAHPLVRGAA